MRLPDFANLPFEEDVPKRRVPDWADRFRQETSRAPEAAVWATP